ncbi:MAG TPA: DUF4149 domain-containing protein [Pyrinomonadaceae bacterium]|nr:DUF4149 domain-containing protein [Pyrinomonadaceae bacterium]
MSVEVREERASANVSERAERLEKSRLLFTLFNDARLMVIALWLGAAVFFSAVVAPVVFATLRELNVEHANHAAGSIVTRSLVILNVSGTLASLLLIATAFAFRRGIKRSALYFETATLALLALMTAVGQWVINARMLALRVAMGRPIDDVAPDSPLRAQFNSLHGYSVAIFGVAILAAVAAFLLIARRRQARLSSL